MSVPNVDGILLEAGRLWAVQNFSNQIARIRLAPVAGSTVSSWALAEWATIRVSPLGVAWMPLRLTAPFPMTVAAGPLRARVRNVGPGTPARLTGTKYSWAWKESVNQAPSLVRATSLMSELFGVPNW